MVNQISPTAQLVGEVILGEGNFIGDNCRIYGPVKIGNGNHFAPGAIIGLAGQDDHLGKEIHDQAATGKATVNSSLVIGDNGVFREYSTVHRGIEGLTSVGDGVYLMTYSNISHNSDIGDNVKIASSVQMGGYTTICKGAYIGMSATIHQFSVIGAYCMVGMGSVVTRNVSTASKAFGSPCVEVGPNIIALESLGILDFGWWEGKDFAAVDFEQSSNLSVEHEIFLKAVEQREKERVLIRQKRIRLNTMEK